MQKLDGASFYVAPPLGSGQCLGAVEAIQTLGKNGAGLLNVAGSSGRKEVLSSAATYRLPWRQESFVAQSSPDTCWAAAVAMAFRHLGYSYTEADFTDPMKRICKGGLAPQKATLNQIVYGLTSGYTRQDGIWISDRNGEIAAWERERNDRRLEKLAADTLGVSLPRPAPPLPDGSPNWVFRAAGVPPPPTMLAPVLWTTKHIDGRTTEGGVFPLDSTDDLWGAISRNEPVVLGIARGGRRHVVLVTGVTVRVGGYQVPGTNEVFAVGRSQSKIEAVEVADPAGDGAISVIGGDDLMRQVRFAFAVKP